MQGLGEVQCCQRQNSRDEAEADKGQVVEGLTCRTNGCRLYPGATGRFQARSGLVKCAFLVNHAPENVERSWKDGV